MPLASSEPDSAKFWGQGISGMFGDLGSVDAVESGGLDIIGLDELEVAGRESDKPTTSSHFHFQVTGFGASKS